MTDIQKLAGALCQLMPLEDNPADFIDLQELDAVDGEFYLLRVVFQCRNEKALDAKTVHVRKAYFNLFGIASVAKKVMEQCIKTP